MDNRASSIVIDSHYSNPNLAHKVTLYKGYNYTGKRYNKIVPFGQQRTILKGTLNAVGLNNAISSFKSRNI